MRSLVVSFLCLVLLIGTWAVYSDYSDKKIHTYINDIENGILLDVTSDNWPQAEDKFNTLEDSWHQYKSIACFFFSTDKINEADYSIAKIKYYIKAEDGSNASGELSCLKEQLKFLHENESITLQNIF
ncbi:DUF4363 family protein [Clostridium aminobutyricum]|uniref:DUF4363 family protein n=1 Tax=Clostridium aminobutyricum TaxID=33953 RepID=A0A939DAH6_CLOAM|nr:DUF4363 family protein [Clostridium aminobutyricum]MBN7774156.1 DUF4363 family protein [Clostridium aminobutyricum]